jgi:hypothetical protein
VSEAAEMTKSSMKIAPRLMISGLVCFILSLFINPFDWDLAYLSLLSLFVALLPLLFFLDRRQPRDLVIFIPVMVTWIYFCAPYLYPTVITHTYRIIPTAYLGQMATYCTLGISALVLGYYTSFPNTYKNAISPTTLTISQKNLQHIILSFLVLGIVSTTIDYYAPWVLSPFSQLLQILDFAPVLTFSACFLYILRGGRSFFVISLVASIFFLELMLRVSETLFSKIVYIFVSLALVYLIERRRVPWVAVLVCFAILFPIYESRFEHRKEAHDRWHNTSFENREKVPELFAKGFGFLIESYTNWNLESFGDSLYEQGRSRFENVSYLGQCVFLVEQRGKPLKYGETFWWLPFTPVPRAIIPWKPVNYHPTELAVEYGLKSPHSKAAMNFPMLVEMYINFGFIGIVVLSFLQGMLYKWSLSKSGFGIGDLNLLLMINILWHLEKVESNITMIFGGIFQAMITWMVIAYFFNAKRNEDKERGRGKNYMTKFKATK